MIITSSLFGCNPNIDYKAIRNQWLSPQMAPNDLQMIIWNQMVITHTKFGFHQIYGYKEIQFKDFLLLTSHDITWPCIQKEHYGNFQEHNLLGEKWDTFLRFLHNSLYWPLNAFDLHFLLVKSCPTTIDHFIQVSSKSVLKWELDEQFLTDMIDRWMLWWWLIVVAQTDIVGLS